MKERDLKKAYEDIKISDKEKAKIFNNIMENRKKSFNWGPVFGFGLVALASFGLFMVLNKTNDPSNPISPIVANRNVSLENNYRREIITGTKKYLEANKIDIEEIKEGEELVIEGNKIVEGEDYKACKGNLVIKRYNDDFSYSTDVTCKGDDTDLSNSKEYVIYSGTLTDVFELKYGIAVASISNIKKPHFDVLDCTANLIVMDNDGNIKFNKTIESPYTDEDSTVEVINVKKFNDKYYLVLEIANEINFTPSGAGSLKRHYYVMTLDENGKELSFQEMLENGNSISVDSFVGGDANRMFATGSVYDKEANDTKNVIIVVGNDFIDTIPYKVTEDTNKKGVVRNVVVSGYGNEAFFGYKYDKSFDGGSYYSAKTLFKMNMDGEVKWETKIDDDVIKADVFNEKFYVLAHTGSMFRIYVFRLDGQQEKILDLKDFYHVSDFYVEGTTLIVKGSDKKDNQFFETFNKDLDLEEKIEIDNTDIKENFEYSFMQYAKLENKKVIAGYTVNKNFVENDEVLLVFNK